MSKQSNLKILLNGIIKENPVLVLILGTCPTLAVTSMAVNGLGMGLAATAVLLGSNIVISLLRKVIPDKVRIPCYIVIIAGFVTIVGFLLEAYVPSIYEALGLYLPLIVVNCIILGRAEAYANKVGPGLALFDGLGMGLGFTIALTLIGMIREFLGAGSLFGRQLLPDSVPPIAIFVKAPGAFLVIALIIAALNAFHIANHSTDLVSGCDGCCNHCSKAGCHNEHTEEKSV